MSTETTFFEVPETNPKKTINYTDGSKYVGTLKNGKRDGKGTYTYKDGGKYEGEWKNNDFHGQGTLTQKDGGKYEGEWKNNDFHGQGTIYSANGRKYEGKWECGKKHGQGLLTDTIGVCADGKWVKDIFVPEIKIEKKHKPVIYFLGNTIDISQAISSTYQLEGDKKSKLLKIPSGEKGDFEIEKFISQTHDKEKQVVLIISSHGSKSGRIEDKEQIKELLEQIKSKIISHNEISKSEDEIKRLKINLNVCYGDKVIEVSLKNIISEFVDKGIDVRTSSCNSNTSIEQDITTGKNNMPWIENKIDDIEIIEKLFSKNENSINKFIHGKKGKYKNIKREKNCATGSKIYKNNKDFLKDSYITPKTSPIKTLYQALARLTTRSP